ncbi:MAG: Maf family protein [Endomicrobia bacterium]|nr:Maf family protein [Endomicrobiia bacterium]MCL2506732.1 Maf family protein [Endomicrobiia bacterium]
MRGKNNRKIVLASASPRRISLLKEWGLDFEILPSDIDEKTALKKPSYIVKDLSCKKGFDIAGKRPQALIISADTIVFLNGRIVGKPKDKKESEKIIRELNGSIHKVYSGVSIIDNVSGKSSVFYDVALVKMRKLPEARLKELFGKHMDKAGAYAVQDTNDDFVEKIYGDYYTVVGLPYVKLARELKKFGVTISK